MRSLPQPTPRAGSPLAAAALLVLGGCAGPASNPRSLPAAAPTEAPPAPAPGEGPAPAAATPPADPAERDPSPPEHRPLDLRGAVALALERNPDVHLARARIEAASQALRAADAAFAPTLGLEAGYLRADAPSLYLFRTIDSGRYVPGTDFNDPGTFENWQLGVGLRWNLYAGGRDRLGRELAGLALEGEQAGRAAVENSLVSAVVDGWYAVRAAAEAIGVARSSLAAVEAQLDATRARLELGAALASDLDFLEVRRAEAEDLLLRSENRERLARAALAELLGESGGRERELRGDDATLPALPEELAAAHELARGERPELVQARTRARLGEGELELAERAWRPRADLFGRGWRDAPHADFDESRDNWALGVELSWSFFDGGARGAGEGRARAELAGLRELARKAELAVELDVERAWLRREEARSRQTVAARGVEHATRNLERVRASFEQGAVPVTHFLEAEWMHTRARLRASEARFDRARAAADLTRAVGLLRHGLSADSRAEPVDSRAEPADSRAESPASEATSPDSKATSPAGR